MDATMTHHDPGAFRWRGLSLTPSAAAQIRHLVARKPELVGLRLGVKSSGCAGYAYTMTTVEAPSADDRCFSVDGAHLYVAEKDMPLLDGTEVDFVREGLNQIFRFSNPNARNECGCGESFGVQG